MKSEFNVFGSRMIEDTLRSFNFKYLLLFCFLLSALMNVQCLGSIESRLCLILPGIPTPKEYSATERFYLQARPLSSYLDGLRIIENVKHEIHPAGVSRLTFENQVWYACFFSENPSSDEFQSLVRRADREILPIQPYDDGGMIAEVQLIFEYKYFLKFNSEVKHQINSVTIYQGGLLAYFNKNKGTIMLVLIPKFPYDEIKTIVDTYCP
ncbi:hypothetical protein ACFL27_16750 [candidate division CSSED10-310 bacterium]|uniref:Uncharacterized protein n=1 Tax=candidate division CSSED10-310 bacterium TaxID=2855610 RepID=A0ABV6Z064_UNCC1